MNFENNNIVLKNALDSTISLLKNNKHGLIEDILQRLLIDTLKKYQEKVIVGAEDSVSDLLDTFKSKILNEIFDLSQKWLTSSSKEKMLFPKNCRFLYNVGNSTVVVVEEPMSYRNLTFDSALLLPQGSARVSTRVTSRRNLPLPYTVFVLHFVNSNKNDLNSKVRLSNLYVSWAKSPLQTLEDKLYQPILPNIHDGCSVCMGKGFIPQGDNICQLTDNIISTFWSSSFNIDLSKHWWSRSSVDSRLTSIEEWEDLNPIDMMNMNYLEAYTSLDSLLTRCVNALDEVDETLILKNKLTGCINKCSEQMFEKILKYFHKTKFDKYYPKDINENLGQAISLIMNDLIELVISMEIELNRLSLEVNKTQKDIEHFGWESKGAYWNATV